MAHRYSLAKNLYLRMVKSRNSSLQRQIRSLSPIVDQHF
ncbi:hypothetical protein CTL2C_757 [Chlamydia trachomatis L2c]|nr:hypothetical protein CTL2C_757 [Chlamydia trachomatis L2c]